MNGWLLVIGWFFCMCMDVGWLLGQGCLSRLGGGALVDGCVPLSKDDV